MKGKFFLYLNYAVAPKNGPSREWEGIEHADLESASEAAKRKVENGADEVQIFQLCGTAKKAVVIE